MFNVKKYWVDIQKEIVVPHSPNLSAAIIKDRKLIFSYGRKTNKDILAVAKKMYLK